MRKPLFVTISAACIVAATVTAPTKAEARCYGCWAGAGILAGVIGGALIRGAYTNSYYGGYGYGPYSYYRGYGYGYAPTYYAPAYYGYPGPVYRPRYYYAGYRGYYAPRRVYARAYYRRW